MTVGGESALRSAGAFLSWARVQSHHQQPGQTRAFRAPPGRVGGGTVQILVRRITTELRADLLTPRPPTRSPTQMRLRRKMHPEGAGRGKRTHTERSLQSSGLMTQFVRHQSPHSIITSESGDGGMVASELARRSTSTFLSPVRARAWNGALALGRP
ncbi:hypothetical protein PoB_005761600 [Plakobranchus ocellatus]|uniref:Uncharacterized protein n=1 Tax=Plakobranchus ocellatus TaxID=259542 RepID=A0AAV4CI26_9GAST|nr:hypothetical protein PoB_005761600 [Plakobranchus ocellatus]